MRLSFLAGLENLDTGAMGGGESKGLSEGCLCTGDIFQHLSIAWARTKMLSCAWLSLLLPIRDPTTVARIAS